MPRIALLSTSDTDLLSARGSGADYVVANPARSGHTELGEVIGSSDVVVARILGGPQDLCSGFRRVAETGVPLVVLGGEQTPDAALMELSRLAPVGVVHEAHRYLAQGGADNLRNLHAFLSDTLLLTGRGFDPPAELPAWGVLERSEPVAAPPAADGVRPRVGVLFYRAQQAADNTAYVHALCDAVDAAGGVGVPIYATSLRDPPADLLDHLGTVDALVTTVLAAGGTRPATAQAGGDDGAWDVRLGGLGRRDVTARRRDPGCRPRVRRAPGHRRVLVQGNRRRRPPALRCRHRAVRARRRHRRQARPPTAHARRAAARCNRPVCLPDEALAHRQRRWSRHPRLDGPAPTGHG